VAALRSGADLIECIKACAKGLGGVSEALTYVRVAQNGGGDPLQLLTACVEVGLYNMNWLYKIHLPHSLKVPGLAQPLK
jgi:hypothetical protein